MTRETLSVLGFHKPDNDSMKQRIVSILMLEVSVIITSGIHVCLMEDCQLSGIVVLMTVNKNESASAEYLANG